MYRSKKERLQVRRTAAFHELASELSKVLLEGLRLLELRSFPYVQSVANLNDRSVVQGHLLILSSHQVHRFIGDVYGVAGLDDGARSIRVEEDSRVLWIE